MTPPMPANSPKQPEVKDAYAVVGEMLEYFDSYNLATWAPLASIIERERIAAEHATRAKALEEAARKAEHSCYDYGNTIEPSINDNGSKAFGFGFDYACEVIAAAIRAMKEEPKP